MAGLLGVLVVAGAMPTTALAAAYATGGSSPYRNTVLWLTWGGGVNGTHDAPLSNGSSSSISLPVAAGVNLDVTCSLDNVANNAGLRSYRPGVWRGDSLDDMYNIGGTGTSNQLIAGISRAAGSATFSVNCSSTLGGQPYRLRGVVMADAESINTNTEYVQASAIGTWNIVELRKNLSAGAYMARKWQTPSGSTTASFIRFGPGNDDNTAAVTFLSFDDAAYAPGSLDVSMDFAIQGGGTTAIAIGLLVPFADFGDAPSSYGTAMHVVDDLRFNSDGLAANGNVATNINTAGYNVGGIAPPASNYLGTRGPDTEQSSPFSSNAKGDDDFPSNNPDEENAWSPTYRLTVMQAGTVISQPVQCAGTGSVKGWIDFDINGQFDSDEGSNVAACSSGSATLQWTVPAGMKAGTSFVRLRYASNPAEIQNPTGTATDGEVEDHQLTIIAPALRITKSNNASGNDWTVGQAGAEYTLTVSNISDVPTGNPPNVPAGTITVLDDLPAGIVPRWSGTLSSNGWSCAAAGQRVTCTTNQILAGAGNATSTSSIVLPVTITGQALGTLVNHASVGGGHDPNNDGIPPEPGAACAPANYCASNTVNVPTPTVGYHKTSSAAGAVAVGDTITYTLTATVANGSTRGEVTLTDTLGTGLDFGAVTVPGPFTCNAANPLVCTLPANTAPGPYALSYTAVVNGQASGQVTNAVVGTGTDNPACDASCTTSTPIAAPTVGYSKSASTTGPVAVGDAITYTLTAVVGNSKTTDVVTLTDTLGTGLDFGSVTSAGSFTCNAANPLVCTLPAGTVPGTYSLAYTATVNAQASGTVTNAVVGSGGDTPSCTGSCNTSTPVATPSVTVNKATSTTGPVAVGDSVDYTLTVVVSNSKTTGVVTLTDTLGTGLDFSAVTSPGAFTCNAANPLVCTLPAGTVPGTYTVSYRATVNAQASGSVTNAVVPSGPDTPTCGTSCGTTTPVAAPSVTVNKATSTTGPVSVGDSVDYTLTVVVSNSKTTGVVTLTDTLGTGLDFGAVTSPGAFTCNAANPLVCTLPAGTAPGTYTVSYRATVNAQASGSVTNAVVPSGPDTPTCGTACGTTTPVATPSVTVNKTTSTTGPVSVGDSVDYMLTVVVSNSKTTGVVTLTDTLGTGLDFGAVTSPGAFTCNAANPLVCTLPAGTVPGTYTVSYRATVNAQASGTVTNAVVPSGPDTPTCGTSCGTATPVATPSVTVNKTTSTTGPVSVGDSVDYTLTVVVSNSKTTGVVTLTDTLGTGLDFGAVTSPGAFTCNAANPLVCTLPAGSAPGTYTVSYRATVNAQASGTVTNAVVPSGPDTPTCGTACGTTTPVTKPGVDYSKSASTTGPVAVGDVITYTLTAVVSNSKTTDVVTLTDTLGTGLDFGAVTSPGAFTCNAANPLVCTLPAGTVPGTYSLAYTATVNAQASGTVTNAVVGSGSDTPSCTGSCNTSTPVATPSVTVNKTTSTTGPVAVGDSVDYTLTVVVSNSKTTGVVTLTDTLGTGLDFGSVTSAGGFTCNAANPLVCTLPAGTVPGTYTVSYRATVNAQASGSVTNAVVPSGPDTPTCGTACGTTTPVATPSVTVNKTTSTTGPVSVGDSVDYTLTVVVSNSKTTGVVTLTDTLGTGLDFGSVTSAGGFTCNAANPLVCTLPAGTVPGTYSVSYRATVNAQASGTVTNAVVPSGPDTPTCGTSCGTSTPVTTPSVGYSKSASTAGPVAVGDVLTYTLTAVVGNSKTTDVVTLTDTLGTGLDFGSVTSAGSFSCNAANPLVCTLPVGTVPGTYSLTYTATVNAQASGTVTNAVVGTGGDTPSCTGSCNTNTPVATPSVTVNKTTSTTGPVAVGDSVDYTLTVVVSNSKTTGVVTLTDTLGTGLDFSAVTSPGAFTCNAANPLVCTLPAGTVPGTYSVSYRATVNAQASGTVTNAVVPSGPDTPTCGTACGTTTPVTKPGVGYSKSVSTAGPVVVGDMLTYTLTAVVSNSKTTDAVTLTDTLGAGLDFGAVTASGAFTCNAANPLVCTLPAGTVPGTYSLTYTARVNAQASGTVTNAVVGSGGDTPNCVGSCSTSTPLTKPGVGYSKSVSTAGPVAVGDVLTYTLTAVVSNSKTTDTLTLTDTLSNGLDFGAVTASGAFTCNAANPLVCTLPAGTVPGTYSLTYTATVNAQASGTVTNAVVGSGGDTPSCTGSCNTSTPVARPSVTVNKATSTTGPVAVGDSVDYTLTVVVSNSKTTGVVTLTDTLGTGLDFGSVTSAGSFTCNAANPLVCTLPAGSAPGTYTVSYRAVVNAQASGSVTNAVVPSGPDTPTCGTSCGTTTPVTKPGVGYSKSASTPGPVAVGDVITYTLTAVVSNSKTTDVVTLTDTLGTGLDFGAVTSPGAFTCNAANPLVCTLPAGTVPGTYSLAYTATVNAQASGTVTNAVVGSGSDTPSCTGSCNTSTPVATPSVTVNKTTSTTGPVSVGDSVDYTLTVVVANSKTTGVVTLTDTLGTGLDFGSVTSAGSFTCNAANPLVCTLPAGSTPGTYTVSYRAVVNAQASGTVTNAVVPSGPDTPTCGTACGTTTPVTKPGVGYSKSVSTAGPVAVGDTLTYTLTAVVSNSKTTDTLTLTDTLGAGLDFGSVTSTGSFTCNAANPLVCTLPAGTAPGTYSLTYTARVNAQASGTVTNAVVGSGGDTPSCTGSCNTSTPVATPSVTVNKTTSTTGPVSVGDSVDYTLTVVVANSKTTGVVTLTDTLGTGLDFGSVTSTGSFTCNAANPLVCTLPAGSAPGTYTVSYRATVNAQASGSVTNAVVPSGPDTPTCGTACGTTTPVTKPGVSYSKSASTPGPVAVGDTLTYTLTAVVSNSKTTDTLTLTDTLGAGLDFGSVTSAGSFSCSAANPLVCTLPAGTVPGTYSLAYTATVNAQASGTVTNAVVGSGSDTPSCTGSCNTSTPVATPSVTVNKATSTTGPVAVGDSVDYTLTVVVSNSKTTGMVTLTDTLGTGLDFGSVTSAGGFTCNAANPLVCTLPAGTVPGTYTVSYRATVNAQASGSVTNAVVPSGPDTPTCGTACGTTTPVADSQVSYRKTSAAAGAVKVGDSIAYTLAVTVAKSRTTAAFTLTDTLGTGLDFGSITDAGAFACVAGNPMVCTLPAGTVPGDYSVRYTAVVNAQAKGNVTNAVVGNGNDTHACTTDCSTTTPVLAPAVTYRKTSATAGPLAVGDVVDYAVTVTVSNSQTTDVVTLTDTLGTGLDFGGVTNAGSFSCNAANPLVCTLPAGTAPGSYALAYQATVNAQAKATVRNSVVATGGDTPTCAGACSVEHEVRPPQVQVSKGSVPASGSEVLPGDTITYTLTAVVGQSALTEPLTLADTLGSGLSFGAVSNAGAFACSGQLQCELPAGTAPGTYVVTYTATVDATATGQLSNQVVASNPPGGDPEPECTSCSTTHVVPQTVISVTKTSLPAAGTTMRAGDVISYTLTAEVAQSATTAPLVLNDTLGAGLRFESVTASGAFACSASLVCTLPAGTAPGSYSVTYSARVADDASGPISNVVAGEGGGGQPPSCVTCGTTHPLAEPRVVLDKSADPASGSEVRPGDRVRYTLAATIENAALRGPLQLLDTPDGGLTLGELPEGCALQGGQLVCTLPAGTLPGRHVFEYVATVNETARSEVHNRLRGVFPDGGGQTPECGSCETVHRVISDFALRIVKTATPRLVKIGDLVRYQLVVENVGASNWHDGVVVDTPPAGFSYVDGSMSVADDDGAFVLGAGQSPLRIGGLDIAVGRSATVTYLLRVGAGVRAGNHVNQAVATGDGGEPLSNVATAEVQLDADPMLEDSLVFGSVFDDRDGDGWQDSAELTGVRVQGGFAPSAYIANSTTVDRGQGPEPVADASSPLLHGLSLGTIQGRASVADPSAAHQVVVRQRLRELAFTDDFVLTSEQGANLRLDAQGQATALQEGDARKGLTAAQPQVSRRVAKVADGYEVAYVIRNEGIQEQGIPGVRLASVEGLLVETDQFGRYHLADVHGGDSRLGRNFILKLDPATVPAGAELTTENPLLRRVTQGVPTRFSFGVRLPAPPQPAAERAELALGEVWFAPGSSELREAYRPAVERMAEVVDRYQGGDVVIAANGESEALALARAAAVSDALQAQVQESARAGLTVQLRSEAGDPQSLVAGITARGALLGTVLFDTDKADIRPQFRPLLAELAARLERMPQADVSLVGHTDVRASHAYNQALGLRRANAVFEALRGLLGPEARKRLRVHTEEDAVTPAIRQQEVRR
ncbi:CshA/CshB family fibrillar adhesin-related protein [Pseudomonas sp. Hp2]|nr:CshA/CshB family fibrillar adhesin-related protein [Pseudomonas sp. Hp2]